MSTHDVSHNGQSEAQRPIAPRQRAGARLKTILLRNGASFCLSSPCPNNHLTWPTKGGSRLLTSPGFRKHNMTNRRTGPEPCQMDAPHPHW